MAAEKLKRQSIPVEERLFSLVLALLATETGLTKNEILSTVQGYRQKYEYSGENSSLERQFERDKDDIRELGIPLETLEPSDEPGNNQHLRYRIPKGAYNLPAEITFSPEEISLLNLAALAWREGSLSRDSRHALLKLRSLGIESSEPLLGYAPKIGTNDPALTALTDALNWRVLVRFSYLKPGEVSAQKRTLAPLAVVQHYGRWHLYGIDQDAGEPRTFLLSRIVGPVFRTRNGFDRPEEGFARHALEQLDELWKSQHAVVRVQRNSDAESRLLNRPGTVRGENNQLTVHFSDLHLLADELSSYGPEVLVLDPTELKNQVRTRLLKTLSDHLVTAADSSSSEKNDDQTRKAAGEELPTADSSRRKKFFAHGQDRLAFLLALVPYLIDRVSVTVSKTAQHFHVTEEYVRDAVSLIAVSGVPGATSQYQYGDLFDIDWDAFEQRDEIQITHKVALDDSLRFSAREAAALIAGLQYLQALPETLDSAVYASLMAKLAHGASDIPMQVAVSPSAAQQSLLTIRDAVAAECSVSFNYRNSSGNQEKRIVDPLRIDSHNEEWYLRGWCHARQGIRTFRIDRISDLVLTATPIVYRPGDFVLPDHLFEGSDDTVEVTLEAHPVALTLLGEYVRQEDFFVESSSRVQTVSRVAHFHGLKRVIASLAGIVRVAEPKEARQAVHDWAQTALSYYSDADVFAAVLAEES